MMKVEVLRTRLRSYSIALRYMTPEQPSLIPPNSCALVAIAKNEARYLPEWIAYHLSIGLDNIIVYDNESQDDTPVILGALTQHFPVQRVFWPSRSRSSPQRSAYNDTLPRIRGVEWAIFIDIDEFVVPWGYHDFPAFLRAIPTEAASVAINWRTFGSSGVVSPEYNDVLKTFTRCANQDWANNRHVKTVARVSCIEEVRIHDVQVRSGEKLDSSFALADFGAEGKTNQVIYSGIQINHYQTKTWLEFGERMARGNANFPPDHPGNKRDGTLERFQCLDRNEEEDERVKKFLRHFEHTYAEIKAVLA